MVYSLKLRACGQVQQSRSIQVELSSAIKNLYFTSGQIMSMTNMVNITSNVLVGRRLVYECLFRHIGHKPSDNQFT